MKPNITTAGICVAASAALTIGLTGITATAEPLAPGMATKLAGKTVFLDPGHQGTDHGRDLTRQVGDGRGGTTDCQSTGMATGNGVPEHTINWDVAQLVKTSLESLGAQVVLSRDDDTGWGGCVDERAAAANASDADVAVSIHAEDRPASQRGFHLVVPQLPLPDAEVHAAQSSAGRAASEAVRDGYVNGGFPAAGHGGATHGVQTSSEIAGPALTHIPNVFVEMGNGANPDDAAALESRQGQLGHAIAITTGLVGYLLDVSVPGQEPAADPATSPTVDDPPFRADTGPEALSPPGGSPDAAQPEIGTGSSNGIVGTATKFLLPLVETLGIERSEISKRLIDLAYTLVGILFAPTD